MIRPCIKIIERHPVQRKRDTRQQHDYYQSYYKIRAAKDALINIYARHESPDRKNNQPDHRDVYKQYGNDPIRE